MENICSCSSLA